MVFATSIFRLNRNISVRSVMVRQNVKMTLCPPWGRTGRMEAFIHPLLNLALDVGEWSTTSLSIFTLPWSGRFGEGKKPLPLQGIETRSLGYPIHSLVTISTTLRQPCCIKQCWFYIAMILVLVMAQNWLKSKCSVSPKRKEFRSKFIGNTLNNPRLLMWNYTHFQTLHTPLSFHAITVWYK